MDWKLFDTQHPYRTHCKYSICRFHSESIWKFRQYIDRLKPVVFVNFGFWSKYAGWIPFPSIRNDLYIVVVYVLTNGHVPVEFRRLYMTKHTP